MERRCANPLCKRDLSYGRYAAALVNGGGIAFYCSACWRKMEDKKNGKRS